MCLLRDVNSGRHLERVVVLSNWEEEKD